MQCAARLPEALPEAAEYLVVSAAALLASARARLERQTPYRISLGRGGRRAAALRDALDRAEGCVAALARPQAVRIPLGAQVAAAGVLIAGAVTVGDSALARDIAAGGRLGACLATLGYDQAAAFERLGRDYALHHVQTDLARETLFALVRASDRAVCARRPALRLRRIPVRAHDSDGRMGDGRMGDGSMGDGTARRWDAAQVQSLLAAFGPHNPGVGITASGFFQPLHSLLGLSVVRAG